MVIKEIKDEQEKKEISRSVLESLPNWFGIQEATENYIRESSKMPFFVALDESKVLGFVAIKENTPYTAEVYVMGVIPDSHNQGIGTSLMNKIVQWAKEKGYEFLQVKTLDESHPDKYYAKTRRFYTSVGFRPLECLPELWGRDNPCLIMIRHID
ncbi:MAG: GNAT family N-acetyltransferase [Clostridia bacterium]|jgi:GNAT superfamily N-acetyltransferase|nr:GNAT family N-acetyltransferase [Thermoanaerobacterales bacterium]